MEKRRRVLVLAYFFPPLGGAGVQRTLKFVQLPRAARLATRPSSRPARGTTRRATSLCSHEVPGTRASCARPPSRLLRWMGLVPYRLRLMRVFAWLTWPDGGFGWSAVRVRRGAARDPPRAPRRHLLDLAAAGRPLVALLVHRLTGIPWVSNTSNA